MYQHEREEEPYSEYVDFRPDIADPRSKRLYCEQCGKPRDTHFPTIFGCFHPYCRYVSAWQPAAFDVGDNKIGGQIPLRERLKKMIGMV